MSWAEKLSFSSHHYRHELADASPLFPPPRTCVEVSLWRISTVGDAGVVPHIADATLGTRNAFAGRSS